MWVTWGNVDNSGSMSSGSLSPDLGEMWRYGSPKSPDQDSDIDEWADEEEVSEYVMWNMRHGLEGALWESVRAFLVPDDVLCTRATAGKWYVAGLHGPFAELYFLPHVERFGAV